MHSSAFRDSPRHEALSVPAHAHGAGTADPRCVSYHHDVDYCVFTLPEHERYCGADGRNHYMATWRTAMREQAYWQVGTSVADVVRAGRGRRTAVGADQCAATLE